MYVAWCGAWRMSGRERKKATVGGGDGVRVLFVVVVGGVVFSQKYLQFLGNSDAEIS